MITALEVLNKYWNYTSFKKSQEKIIAAVLKSENTVTILPTGGGKSLCYQVPALVMSGVCLVISPLIALMNDQVINLKNKGIKAIAITSALNQEEIITAFDNLQYGNYKFVYLSPEKLQSEFIQQKIKQLDINLIAVDEAHCISEWGHDFRPAYLKIPIIKELHPKTPIIALTATATSRVLNDIIKYLDIPDSSIFKQSLIRKNLALKVIDSNDFYYHTQQILSKSKQPAILYANSRKKVKEISDYLNRNNFKSSFYHGGLLNEQKQLSFSNWMQEKTPIMVATNAFGMGIDKSNVQHIIHLDLPYSLENYMQEAGRAGRDENGAFSYIFRSDHMIDNIKNRFLKGKVSVELTNTIYNNLNQHFHIAYGEIPEGNFDFDLADFCTHYKTNILQTYNTLKLLEKEQILLFIESFSKQSTLTFTALPNEVLRYSENNNSELIKIILRSYGGIFEFPVKINETVLAKKLNLTVSDIKDQITKLVDDGLVTYNFRKNAGQIQFLVPREDNSTIHKIASNIKQHNTNKSNKINSVVDYVNNKTICRSNYLLNYFSETNTQACGICDICINASKKPSNSNYKELSIRILALLSAKQSLTSKEIIANFELDSSIILTTLQLLLDTDKISINSQNKLEKV